MEEQGKVELEASIESRHYRAINRFLRRHFGVTGYKDAIYTVAVWLAAQLGKHGNVDGAMRLLGYMKRMVFHDLHEALKKQGKRLVVTTEEVEQVEVMSEEEWKKHGKHLRLAEGMVEVTCQKCGITGFSNLEAGALVICPYCRKGQQ